MGAPETVPAGNPASKDLNFEIQLDLLPNIKLQPYDKLIATDFSVRVEKEETDNRLKNLASEYKTFEDKQDNSKSEIGDQG